MTTSTNDARNAFLQGLAHFEAGRLEPAEQAFRLALSLAPGRPSVLSNLGLTLMHQARWAEAEPLLAQASVTEGADPGLKLSLGECRCQVQDWPGAIAAYRSYGPAQTLPPDAAHGLAFALRCCNQAVEALRVINQVLPRHPPDARLLLLAADLQRSAGRLTEARSHYHQAQAAGADPALVGFYLASMEDGRVDAPPPGYVEGLFDEYARDFEQHLVGTLGYVAHQNLVQGLPPAPAGGWARALDLGCGTGLVGAALRPLCRQLDGVDLSRQMVERSRERGVYDRLAAAEACEFLERGGERYDLIVAADVLIYIGALERLMQAARGRMAAGGVFGFSVETCEGDGMRLGADLRFQHAPAYLRRVADAAGLSVLREQPGVVRVEQHHRVPGAFVYLRAPG